MKAKFIKLQNSENPIERLDEDNPSSEKRISAQDLKSFQGCGDLTEDQADEITLTIHLFSEFLYDLILGLESEKVSGTVIPLYDETKTNNPNDVNIAA